MKKKTKIIQRDPFTLIKISPKYIRKTAINYNNNCIWETFNLLLCADSSTDTKKSKHLLFYVYICFKCHISYVMCLVSHATYNLSLVTSHQHQQSPLQALPLLSPPLCTVGWLTKTKLKKNGYRRH